MEELPTEAAPLPRRPKLRRVIAWARELVRRRDRDLEPFDPPVEHEVCAPRAPLDC
jgi:hypothetical protein